MAEKYVVFKRQEFKQWYDEWPETEDELPQAVLDAVVIRRQDAFAPPALDAYANAIQTLLEMVGMGVTMEIEQYSKLREIADYFHEQAAKAWDEKRKLPD